METEVLSRSVRGRLTGTRFLSRLRGPRLPEKPNGRLFQVGRRITSLVLWFDPCIRYSKWEIVSFILLDKLEQNQLMFLLSGLSATNSYTGCG
ncbi:hypothetical protein BHE74_00043439 [Ensete ventricosum]|nr:hypothetical protein BHE74_00043439 [Ensete ventricosum]RZR89916.1 hypothetical protein BHM03_00017715 [Ensete ventricosum]